MKDYRTWVYHATEKPKIVLKSEADALFKEGWADTPAAFFDMEKHNLDPKDEEAVQVVGASIKGVKDALNGQLNLGKMSKKQLSAYSDKHVPWSGIDLTDTKKTMVFKINKAIDNGRPKDWVE